MALLLVFMYPASILAEDSSGGNSTTPVADSSAPSTSAPAPTTDPSTTSNTAPQNQSGPTTPPGPSSKTYTYNSTTGLWENDYYTWNPATNQTKPKNAPTYSYNPSTGMWDTTQWVFDAAVNKYVPNVVSVASNPNPTSTTGTSQTDPNSINQTGPSSDNSINNSTSNNGTFNLFYNAAISNNINSNASSGNAAVFGNTLGGSALSGDANNITNVMNMLQSSFNLQPSNDMLTFTSNINGNVTGDLKLDPGQISNTGPLSANDLNTQTNNNLTVNQQGSGLINNDINLNSNTGNALVSKNTTGGNATTGTANAVADVVNMLNSAVSANKSFMGVVNINGNLNGDILLPDNFLSQLIANSGPSSTVNNSQTVNNNINANLVGNQNINNNVNLAANSGTATVNNNTTAGNATTGNATTNLTIMNLTGKQVVGSNSILVFVNVLGKWVGLIMDAPAGSTSAALCGGSCQTSSTTNNNLNVNSTSNNTINNNINSNAQSGNAAVTDNTTGGNAASGNASSSANLLNVINSQLSLSGWFGVLFINVFGSWNGSFGVNTAAGNPVGGMGGGLGAGLGSGVGSGANKVKAVFRFVPGGNANKTQLAFVAGSNDQGANQNNNTGVLASHKNGGTPPLSSVGSAKITKGLNLVMPLVVSTIVISVIFGAEYGVQLSDRLRVSLLQHRMNK